MIQLITKIDNRGRKVLKNLLDIVSLTLSAFAQKQMCPRIVGMKHFTNLPDTFGSDLPTSGYFLDI